MSSSSCSNSSSNVVLVQVQVAVKVVVVKHPNQSETTDVSVISFLFTIWTKIIKLDLVVWKPTESKHTDRHRSNGSWDIILN